jgi:two-component system cell cycle response regulator
MTSEAPLYRHNVLYLCQSFFIKDNRAELLLHAHKYDFDIRFFSELAQYVAAVDADRGDSLFVIDLDTLHNMQADLHDARKTLMLGELLARLPPGHRYVYLQSCRQGSRFLLQQRLVDSHCLAYAEKPIANDVLVDKLFNLFVQNKRGDAVTLVTLGLPGSLDDAALRDQCIDVTYHADPSTLHLRVKELQPDLVLIPDSDYLRVDALARVLQKNIEADPVREIVLLQRRPDDALARRALGDGFDAVLPDTGSGMLEAQLANRAAKICANKDLIGKDRRHRHRQVQDHQRHLGPPFRRHRHQAAMPVPGATDGRARSAQSLWRRRIRGGVLGLHAGAGLAPPGRAAHRLRRHRVPGGTGR